MSLPLERALARQRGSRSVAFREGFDPAERGEWCELVRDVVALANSGGGWLLVGIGSRGVPSGFDVTPILALHPAHISEHVQAFTGERFDDVEIVRAEKDGQRVAALRIGPARVAMVFERAGSYARSDGRQRTAFPAGTTYFRHGSRSVPGTTQDLQDFLDRRLEEIRKGWVQGVKKVVEAPAGAQVEVVPQEIVQSASPSAQPIRVTDDPDAPIYRVINPDANYPFRQKDVIAEVNRRLGGAVVNQHTILSVRRVFAIEGDARYQYRSRFGTPQYSQEFIDWLIGEYQRDAEFFNAARRAYGQLRQGAGSSE
jgi:hypothetical protein